MVGLLGFYLSIVSMASLNHHMEQNTKVLSVVGSGKMKGSD